MNSPDTINAIARSLKATADGKAISDVVDMAANVVASAQNLHGNRDEYCRLAIDAWNLVYVSVENNRQNGGKVSEPQYGELVKVLEAIQKVFNKEDAVEHLPEKETPDFRTHIIGELRLSLLQCVQQFNFTSFDDVQHRADDLAMGSHKDLLAGTTKSVNIGDNANLSQSSGNAIGFGNVVTNNTMAANNSGSKNINAIVHGNNNAVLFNDHIDSTKQDEILNRLRRAPAQYSSFKGEGGCMPGTRTLVLKQAMAWVKSLNPVDPPIFWLYGAAGTGKSTIAYSVAEQCSELSNHLSASFFFTHTNGDCSNANLFFTTIAYQLASLNSDLKDHIANRIKRHVNPGDIRPDVQLTDLIIRPLSDLGNKSPIIIIVDALDECSDTGIALEILGLLSSRISNLPFLLKFFITSRPEPPIRAMMEARLNARPLNISHDVDPSSTNHDVRLFLADRLREGARKMFGNIASWLEEKEIDDLVHQSGGLFIYASTAVKFVLDRNFMNPRVQLEKLLRMWPASGLEAMNALYLRILRGALPEGADETLKREFQLVLGAIVVVKEALSLQMLEALLGLEAGTVRRILSGLHSVVAIPDHEDDEIHTLHPSFPRYLTNRQSFTGADARFFIDPAECHAQVAKCCFKHMKTSLKENICGFGDFSRIEISIENEEQSKLISRRIAAVVKYSCRHFATHLRGADVNLKDLGEMLADWAHQRLLYWLEVLVLLSSLGIALPSLTLLSEWLKKPMEPRTEVNRAAEDTLHPAQSVHADGNVLSLLGDTARMVSEFFDAIRHRPSQIYISCIFAPTQSTFYRWYCLQRSDIQILHGSCLTWGAITVLHEFNYGALALAFSSNGRVLASSLRDGTIRLWNLDTAECQVISEETGGSIGEFISFSPDDKYIAAKRRIYDIATGQKVLRDADCIGFSSGGRHIALSGERGGIDLYDSQSHTCLVHLSKHRGSITSLTFSPDGKRLASVSRDSTLRIWSIETFTQVACLSCRESIKRPHSLTFSPNSAYLAFCDEEQVCLWVTAGGAVLNRSHTWDKIGQSRQPMFSSDSKSLAWVTDKGSIMTVQLDRVDKKPYRHKSGSYCSSAFSPSGKTIFAGDYAGMISLLRLGMEGKQMWERVHNDYDSVIGIVSSPSSRNYASWSRKGDSGSICVWEVDEDASPPTQTDDWKYYLAVFAPDGKSIAIVSRRPNYSIGKLDALTGQRVLQWQLRYEPRSLEFSSDGRYLATRYGSHTDLWLWKTGKRFDPVPTPPRIINGYAFSLDATYIALCYEWKNLYVANLRLRARPVRLGNAEVISSSTLHFSPNGHHLASIAYRHIVVWEVKTGKLHARAPSEVLNEEFSFSPDERHIAYQGREGVHVWDFLRKVSEERIVYRNRVNRLLFSSIDRKYVAAIIKTDGDPRAILIDTDTQNKVAETTEFSSYRAFTREFRRRGRFHNYLSSTNEAIQDEDKGSYPYMVDEEGWVRTTASRPLCRLPRACRLDNDLLKWESAYDTNGNRIVVVAASGKIILIQFGAEPIYEDHPPLRMGAWGRKEIMSYF